MKSTFKLFRNPHPRPGGPEYVGSLQVEAPGTYWIEADIVPHETGRHFEGRLVRAGGPANSRQGRFRFSIDAHLNHERSR